MPALLEHSNIFAIHPVESSVEKFLQSLTAAPLSALLLDFDGTLAPFVINPSSAWPWPGVPELLQQIQDSARTRIAVVTGRPAQDVRQFLPMRDPLDIWGLHGAERLHPDGRLERDELPSLDAETLIVAHELLRSRKLRPGIRIECKWNAIALHWRGISRQLSRSANEYAENLLLPFTRVSGLQLFSFDGGMELRSDHNKGDAVLSLLKEFPDNAPVAYLGDDSTDEDAFQALHGRGLTVLVRPRWRPSCAHLWLRAPKQLRRFLTAWLAALR